MQNVDPNARPDDVTITDPVGNPLPADHPAAVNPQIGRPHSKGDLTLPENQEFAQALSQSEVRRRDVRQVWGEGQAEGQVQAPPPPQSPRPTPGPRPPQEPTGAVNQPAVANAPAAPLPVAGQPLPPPVPPDNNG